MILDNNLIRTLKHGQEILFTHINSAGKKFSGKIYIEGKKVFLLNNELSGNRPSKKYFTSYNASYQIGDLDNEFGSNVDHIFNINDWDD